MHKDCDDSLVSLYGDALDYAERMKSRKLTSFHYLLAYFSTPSEAAVVFEQSGISYRDVAEAYNAMVKMSRMSGSSLKEPVDTITSIETAAKKHVMNKGQKISPLHFLAAVTSTRNSIAYRILQKMGILTDIRLSAMKLLDEPTKKVKERAQEMKQESTKIGKVSPDTVKIKEAMKASKKEDKTDENFLEKFGRNLTEMAKNGDIDPIYGRSREIELIVDILGRRKNNNPMIIGPAGSGKTALVEAVAIKQKEGLLPEKIIWELNLSSIVGGTEYRGSLEKRLGELIEYVEENKEKFIIFIDEVHTLFTSGNEVVGNILKPVLARGAFPLIGATTTAEYNKYIAKDSAMERRFSIVKVEEPRGEQLLKIVQNAADNLSSYHGVALNEDELVRNAISLSNRYISGKSQPDKVLSLLDTLGSVLKREKREEATVEDLMAMVSDTTGIPVESLLVDTSRIIKALPVVLDRSIIGQERAKERIVRLLARRFGNRQGSKPLASMLFAGPTGTGKTEMAKKLASFLFGGEDRMVVFDMSEFQESHSVSKLIGAPPGYSGFEDGGRLTESFRREPYQLLLLDEIEKAHPKVLSLFLQMLEEGRISDTRGFSADMSESIVIMTSNLGADLFSSGKVGFGDAVSSEIRGQEILDKIEMFLSPELLNRMDEVVLFRPFSDDEFLSLTQMYLNEVIGRVGLSEGFSIVVEDVEEACHFVLERMSLKDRQMGARAVKRLVGKLVEGPALECFYGRENREEEKTYAMIPGRYNFDFVEKKT